jgi:hypothetical protein
MTPACMTQNTTNAKMQKRKIGKIDKNGKFMKKYLKHFQAFLRKSK